MINTPSPPFSTTNPKKKKHHHLAPFGTSPQPSTLSTPRYQHPQPSPNTSPSNLPVFPHLHCGDHGTQKRTAKTPEPRPRLTRART